VTVIVFGPYVEAQLIGLSEDGIVYSPRPLELSVPPNTELRFTRTSEFPLPSALNIPKNNG
jgi:hypothetical protein